MARALLMLATDAAMLLAATTIVLLLVPTVPPGSDAIIAAYPAVVLLILAGRRRYRPHWEPPLGHDLRAALSSAAVGTLALSAVALVVDGSALTGSEMLWLAGVSTVTLTIGHGILELALGHARRRGSLIAPTLVVGAGRVGHMVARRLEDRPELGLRPIGFLDKDPLQGVERAVSLPVLGSSRDLERVLVEFDVERVIIAFSTAPDDLLLSIARRCAAVGVGVSAVPRLFEVDRSRPSVVRLGGVPLIELPFSGPRPMSFRLKYAVDRLVAATMWLGLSPVLAAVALAVLLTMGRPILYRQRRVGQDGEVFDMLKFRTMTGAPERSGEADAAWLAAITGEDATVRTAPANRTTPVGRFLRRCSLDELPQIWNVVRGEMSLIGPRPERVEYVRRLQSVVYRYDERHRVRPGITGWAQVNGLRGQTSLEDRVEWDNYYVENQSLGLDLTILVRTVAAVFRDPGDEVSRTSRARRPQAVEQEERFEDRPEPVGRGYRSLRTAARLFGMLTLLLGVAVLTTPAIAAPPSAADQYVEDIPTPTGTEPVRPGDERPPRDRGGSGGGGPSGGGPSSGGTGPRSGGTATGGPSLSPAARRALTTIDDADAKELERIATPPSQGAPSSDKPRTPSDVGDRGPLAAIAEAATGEGNGSDGVIVWLLIAVAGTLAVGVATAGYERRQHRR